MMKKTIACATLLACLAAGSAGATCIYPRAPEHIPDGKTATYDEMVAAQQVVKQFDADVTAYNACLDMEMASYEQSGQFDADRLLELRNIQSKKNNAAVDEVQAIADQFNEQLHIFTARDKKD
ncbi:MAG: hypothetical protein ACRER4_00670 [Steroidobacteraceae bacterium]